MANYDFFVSIVSLFSSNDFHYQFLQKLTDVHLSLHHPAMEYCQI